MRNNAAAVAVNGRGPYGGYRGESGQDPLDVLALVKEMYFIDAGRVYLTGHSMGGGGTVLVGFDHAEHFAALAPLAGFGAATQLEKAKTMPIFIGAGTLDALVPIESARAFHKAATDLGMPEVKYVEKEYDHVAVVDYLLDEVFDWFDAHKKEVTEGGE
jgi:predicted peptidase